MNNQKVAKEILLLQEACFCYAKEIISSEQALVPFAAFLNAKNEIIIEDKINVPINKNRIEYLSDKFKRLSYIEKVKVWIICFDGIIEKNKLKNQEAICIEIHEANINLIRNLYYPYQWSSNKITFRTPITEIR